MIFKPDIDFSKLLDTGRMTHQDLAAFYGRLPTPGELKWARQSAINKHPQLEPLIRSCSARGLYVMNDAGAQAFQIRNLRAHVTQLSNTTRKIESLPTGALDAEQRKRHDALTRCARAISASISETTKALPWNKA